MTALALVALLATAPTPCVLSALEGAARERALCDEIRVPESPDHPEKLISVGFAILEAKVPAPAADPVVFLAGGPGQAATRIGPLFSRALAKVRRERRLVLFDARGTGRSSELACPDPRPRAERLKTPKLEIPELREACIASAAVEPRSITTAQIARDLDEVRKALGAEQLTLVGASYGTRLALTYDALFPGRVRAMVLDGVAPATMILGEGMSDDGNAALAAADARCQAAPACAAQGRRLVDIVRDALARPPVDVEIADPRTGRPERVLVDAKALAAVVRLLLYTDESVAALPPLLRAVDAGDLHGVAAQVLLLEAQEGEVNAAMNLSVVCAEDVPFYSASNATTPGATGPLPDVRADLQKACASWPHATVARAVHEPHESRTPSLLLSGEHDPVTPPARAEEARKSLPASTHVVVPGVGHGVFFRGCVPELVTKFIVDPNSPLDAACAKAMGPLPVFSDAMGP